MSAYICHDNVRVRHSFEKTIHETTGAAVVAAESAGELLDFLMLRQDHPESVLLVVVQFHLLDDADHRDSFHQMSQRWAFPVLLLVDPDNMREAESFLSGLRGDVIVNPGHAAEVRIRLRTLTGLREEVRLEARMEREVRNLRSRRETGMAQEKPASAIPGPLALIQFLGVEWKRCLRYDWPISLILLRFVPDDVENNFEEITRTVADCVRRPGDLVGLYNDFFLAAVLSETDREGATHVAERILGELARLMGQTQVQHVKSGIAALRPLDLYRSLHGVPADRTAAYQALFDNAERDMRDKSTDAKTP